MPTAPNSNTHLPRILLAALLMLALAISATAAADASAATKRPAELKSGEPPAAAATRSAPPAARPGTACDPQRRVASGRTRRLLRCTTSRKPPLGPNGARSVRTASQAPILNLGGTTYSSCLYSDWRGWLHYRGLWRPWNTTTRIVECRQIAGDVAIGTQYDLYHWSTQGWVYYAQWYCSSWNPCTTTYTRYA